MIDENIDKIIVFEDDVVLCENFITKFNEYYNEDDLKNDIIYLGSQYDKEHFNKIKNQMKLYSETFCTHGLIYTKKFAEKICKIINIKGLYVIDILYKEEAYNKSISIVCYIQEPTEDEINKYKLIIKRSYGLCYQSGIFESTIHT